MIPPHLTLQPPQAFPGPTARGATVVPCRWHPASSRPSRRGGGAERVPAAGCGRLAFVRGGTRRAPAILHGCPVCAPRASSTAHGWPLGGSLPQPEDEPQRDEAGEDRRVDEWLTDVEL